VKGAGTEVCHIFRGMRVSLGLCILGGNGSVSCLVWKLDFRLGGGGVVGLIFGNSIAECSRGSGGFSVLSVGCEKGTTLA